MGTIKDVLDQRQIEDVVMDGLLQMISDLIKEYPGVDSAILRALIIEALKNVTLSPTGISITIGDYTSSII